MLSIFYSTNMSKFSDLIPDLLRVWVTDYWETKLNSISVNLNAQLESEEKSLRRMSDSFGGQSFSTTLSEVNRVIREVKVKLAFTLHKNNDSRNLIMIIFRNSFKTTLIFR